MKQKIISICGAFKEGQKQCWLVQHYNNNIHDCSSQQLFSKQKIIKIDICFNNLSCFSLIRMEDGKLKLEYFNCLCQGQRKIDDKGCNYLRRVYIPQNNHFQLKRNIINSVGVSHLAKAEWKNLYLMADGCIVHFAGSKGLYSAKWNKQAASICLRGDQLLLELAKGKIPRYDLAKQLTKEMIIGHIGLKLKNAANLSYNIRLTQSLYVTKLIQSQVAIQ